MDYLARREHSYFELQQKLAKKFPDSQLELIDEALQVLRKENLQSDERFTEAYVRYRKSRGFGLRHIRSDLSQRNVREQLLDAYLHVDDEDWGEILEALVAKRLIPGQKLEFSGKDHRKLLRFLESRGFSSLEISRVLGKSLMRS